VKCEACGLQSGWAEYVCVRLTNGSLNLCRQCLDEFNGKNPMLAEVVDRLRRLHLVYCEFCYAGVHPDCQLAALLAKFPEVK
jgi:hypothetical protein